jgi:hypothetical protein
MEEDFPGTDQPVDQKHLVLALGQNQGLQEGHQGRHRVFFDEPSFYLISLALLSLLLEKRKEKKNKN